MKIIALKAENIKKLVAVEIHPTSNVVKITGKNGQGKTSVLDSIWWALGGAKDIQKSPIRKGCDSGGINIDLGDFIVTRTFKYDKNDEVTTSLSVQNKDGVKFPSPQAMLDKMLGDLTFDPLSFARSSADEQFNKLRQFVPEVDFESIDEENKMDYELRKDCNRRAKEKRAAATQIVVTTIQAQPIDETKLVEEMAKAGQHNADIKVRQSNRYNYEREIANKRQQIKDLEFQIKQIQDKLDNAEKLPEPIDVADLQLKIIEARANNNQIRLNSEKQALNDSAIQLEKQSDDYTKSIEQRNADKQSKIEKAKLPLPELSFGNNEILLNGVPFNQASDAEQLRASIAIAMALNSKLRVIRVRDGSLLDSDSMKIVEEMADKYDCQVWIEVVDGSGKVGFVLEAGELTNQPAEGEPDLDF